MKKLLQISAFVLISLSVTDSFAQRHHRGHGPRRGPVVVVQPPAFCPPPRPAFRRAWRPAPMRHRWIFYPAQNCYWDSFRNQYAFWNGRMWVMQPMAPPCMTNGAMGNQPHYELNDCDQHDNAFAYNDVHRNRYR